MKFPKNIVIRITDGMTGESIKLENIVIHIHIFAVKKNDYYLGPFFSNENGEIHLTSRVLKISADAEMETGLMDYKDVKDASPLVEIKILSNKEIKDLREGRELWGIVGKETDLYRSKETLLKTIDTNNNYKVKPVSIKVLWDDKVPSQVLELKTNVVPKGLWGQ